MPAFDMGKHVWQRLATIGFLVIIIVGALISLGALVADQGMLDRVILRWASDRLHRPVNASVIRFHLFSSDPTITIEKLAIANPTWLRGGNLAEADRLVAHLDIAPLFAGRLRAKALTVSGLTLHLIRIAPGKIIGRSLIIPALAQHSRFCRRRKTL